MSLYASMAGQGAGQVAVAAATVLAWIVVALFSLAAALACIRLAFALASAVVKLERARRRRLRAETVPMQPTETAELGGEVLYDIVTTAREPVAVAVDGEEANRILTVQPRLLIGLHRCDGGCGHG